MKKYFVTLLIVLIGLLVPLSLNSCHKPVTIQETAENETEWMPDKNLRQAVWEALKLDPGTSPTPQALAGLTKLELGTFSTPYKQKISSLKGLEHATGLEVLRLYRHQVKDITPLTDLTKLEWLVLYDNEISDITPLASLTGLKKLNLDSNKIKDITPLLRLTGLEALDLDDTQVVDIKGLMCVLVSLSLSGRYKRITSQGGTGDDLRTPPEGMVLIPVGEFQIGSRYADNELPVRTVYVDAFYMDATEVTNAQYKAFLLENPCWQKGRIDSRFATAHYLEHWSGNNYPSGKGNHPVTHVSWYAAMAYAAQREAVSECIHRYWASVFLRRARRCLERLVILRAG